MITLPNGKKVNPDRLRAIFKIICKQIEDHDPEFYWKESICCYFKDTNEERITLVSAAITFMVGGKTSTYKLYDCDLKYDIVEYTNAGYFRNIGA